MASLSDYLENAILDHITGQATYTAPTVYVALLTGSYDGTDANFGSLVEVTGVGYLRQTVEFGAAASGQVANTAAVTFGPSGESWGQITALALYDQSSTGNLLFHGALLVPKTVGSGDSLVIGIGSLTVTLN